MGHWGPKSTSLSFCSISSVPLRGPLCYLPLLSLPHQTQIAPNFLTPSRLQTGSLYMTATSQTPPLSPHSSQVSFHSWFRHSTVTAVSTDIPSMGQDSPSLSTFGLARGCTVLCPSFRSQAAVAQFFLLLWPRFRFVLPSKSCTV